MKKIVSADIARMAGVSRSTVSRVINGYANVPKETRDKVMKVIDENSYYPLLSGQLLVGKKNRTIGLFWVHSTDKIDYNIANDSLTSSFFMYATETAAEEDYLVLSCLVSDLKSKENVDKIKSIFMQGRIDGGIFIGATNNEPLIEELIELGNVVGVFDHHKDGDWEDNRISVNFDKNTGEKIIDYAYSLGHRDIAIIDGDIRYYSSLQRHKSFLNGMLKHGLTIKDKWMCYGGILEDSGYTAAFNMLKNCDSDYPSVICANNDAVAFGVLKAISTYKPDLVSEISVIGIDGHPNGRHITPSLATFEYNFKEVFSSLVKRTIDTIEGKENVQKTEYISGRLVLGKSCFPPQV